VTQKSVMCLRAKRPDVLMDLRRDLAAYFLTEFCDFKSPPTEVTSYSSSTLTPLSIWKTSPVSFYTIPASFGQMETACHNAFWAPPFEGRAPFIKILY
jgi:hypothetical protein